MLKTILVTGVCLTTFTLPAFAQGFDTNCRPLPMLGYSMLPQPPDPDCQQRQAAEIRRQTQARLALEQAQRQADAQAQAAQNAQIAAEQQIRREADARAAALVAAQVAAETSPNNICLQPNFAGGLIKAYNGLSWGYPAREVVDIEHLVTIASENRVISCHGIWVHTNGARIEGTLSFKPNVAGDMITWWTQETWHPPVVMPVVAPPTPFVAPLPVAASEPQGSTNQAYTDGRNARIAYENWFTGLDVTTEYRAGAEYWAGHRSLKPAPTTCHLVSPAYEAGCDEARRLLTPADIRRKSEPDYKLGWNSL